MIVLQLVTVYVAILTYNVISIPMLVCDIRILFNVKNSDILERDFFWNHVEP